MIAKHNTIPIELHDVHQILDFIQLTETAYVIYGEQEVEQKLKSIHQPNQKKLQLIEFSDKPISHPPYLIKTAILSKIISYDKQSLAMLISVAGNRSIQKLNIYTQVMTTLVADIPYKEHHSLAITSRYKIFYLEEQLILIEIHQYCNQEYGNSVLIEIANFTKNITIHKKFSLEKIEHQIQIKPIINTTKFALILNKELYIIENEFIQSEIQLHHQFKVKYFIQVQPSVVAVIIKDRLDKFYKYMLQREGFEFYQTLNPQEILDQKVKPDTKKKSAVNLIQHKGQYYFIVSNIYNLDEKHLYCNIFKMNAEFQLQLVDGFLLAKATDVSFLSKDEIVEHQLMFQIMNTVKTLSICL